MKNQQFTKKYHKRYNFPIFNMLNHIFCSFHLNHCQIERLDMLKLRFFKKSIKRDLIYWNRTKNNWNMVNFIFRSQSVKYDRDLTTNRDLTKNSNFAQNSIAITIANRDLTKNLNFSNIPSRSLSLTAIWRKISISLKFTCDKLSLTPIWRKILISALVNGNHISNNGFTKNFDFG